MCVCIICVLDAYMYIPSDYPIPWCCCNSILSTTCQKIVCNMYNAHIHALYIILHSQCSCAQLARLLSLLGILKTIKLKCKLFVSFRQVNHIIECIPTPSIAIIQSIIVCVCVFADSGVLVVWVQCVVVC